MSDKEKVNGEEVEVVATVCGSRVDWCQPAAGNLRDREPLMPVAQHQRITEALRGEVVRIESEWKDLYADQMDLVQERDQLRAEVERLEDALETETMRLAACGVAALGYFDGCAEEYHSASLHDVLALRAQLAQQQVPGWKLVPVEPTPEMVSAAEEAHMPFGDMDIALRMAILSAPSAPATVQPDPVKAQGGGWQLAADALPATGKPVLAYYLNSHGMGRRIRAMHVKRFTVEAEEFADPDTQCCEYSEQDDCYYTTEGWYELIDNWPDYASCAVIEGVITHWMPLPAAPAIAAARQEGGKV